jgi:hypothetical protein
MILTTLRRGTVRASLGDRCTVAGLTGMATRRTGAAVPRGGETSGRRSRRRPRLLPPTAWMARGRMMDAIADHVRVVPMYFTTFDPPPASVMASLETKGQASGIRGRHAEFRSRSVWCPQHLGRLQSSIRPSLWSNFTLPTWAGWMPTVRRQASACDGARRSRGPPDRPGRLRQESRARGRLRRLGCR